MCVFICVFVRCLSSKKTCLFSHHHPTRALPTRGAPSTLSHRHSVPSSLAASRMAPSALTAVWRTMTLSADGGVGEAGSCSVGS